jgi:hypothetical protein
VKKKKKTGLPRSLKKGKRGKCKREKNAKKKGKERGVGFVKEGEKKERKGQGDKVTRLMM